MTCCAGSSVSSAAETVNAVLLVLDDRRVGLDVLLELLVRDVGQELLAVGSDDGSGLEPRDLSASSRRPSWPGPSWRGSRAAFLAGAAAAFFAAGAAFFAGAAALAGAAFFAGAFAALAGVFAGAFLVAGAVLTAVFLRGTGRDSRTRTTSRFNVEESLGRDKTRTCQQPHPHSVTTPKGAMDDGSAARSGLRLLLVASHLLQRLGIDHVSDRAMAIEAVVTRRPTPTPRGVRRAAWPAAPRRSATSACRSRAAPSSARGDPRRRRPRSRSARPRRRTAP